MDLSDDHQYINPNIKSNIININNSNRFDNINVNESDAVNINNSIINNSLKKSKTYEDLHMLNKTNDTTVGNTNNTTNNTINNISNNTIINNSANDEDEDLFNIYDKRVNSIIIKRLFWYNTSYYELELIIDIINNSSISNMINIILEDRIKYEILFTAA